MFNDLNQPNQPIIPKPVDDIFAETEKSTEIKKTPAYYSGDSEIETKPAGTLATSVTAESSSKSKIIKITLFLLLAILLLFLAYLAYSKFFLNKEVSPVTQTAPVVTNIQENKNIPEPVKTTDQSPVVSAPITQDTTNTPSIPLGTTTPPVSNLIDSDSDGLTDEEENVLGTNPNLIDSDNDGLSDYEEVKTYNTNPLLLDSDGDSLSDYEEVRVYRTDPKNNDSDGDGYLDGAEVKSGYDPNVKGGKLSDQLK